MGDRVLVEAVITRTFPEIGQIDVEINFQEVTAMEESVRRIPPAPSVPLHMLMKTDA